LKKHVTQEVVQKVHFFAFSLILMITLESSVLTSLMEFYLDENLKLLRSASNLQVLWITTEELCY